MYCHPAFAAGFNFGGVRRFDPRLHRAASRGVSVAVSSRRFEIFSWWTNGGEADGKNALLSIYKKQYTGVTVIDATVAGGAGTNAKSVLVTRMQGGNPPILFRFMPGQELIGTWVTADKMEPITQLFKDQGWDKVMPKLLLDQITYKGDIYSVPSIFIARTSSGTTKRSSMPMA